MRVALWLVTALLSAVQADQLACLGTGPCSCQSSAGVIDLSPLAKTDNTPKFPDVLDDDSGTWYYSYNPCQGFNEDSCKNVAVCQTDMGSQYYDAGDTSSATFVFDATNQVNQIKYSSTDSMGTTRTTYVTLKCDQSQEGSLDAKGEDPTIPGQYSLTLTSKYACPIPAPTSPSPSPSPSPTPFPTPLPTPTSKPKPDIFNLETVVVLLFVLAVGCVLQIVLLALVVVILAVRGGGVTSSDKVKLIQ